MLKLKVHNLGDVAVLQCAGRITADHKQCLRNAVTSQPGAQVVVLDLAETTAIDAAGLGMLVGLRTWADTTGKHLKLMNLLPRVEAVLELTNLRGQFEFCSVADMIDLLCRANRQTEYADPGRLWQSSAHTETAYCA